LNCAELLILEGPVTYTLSEAKTYSEIRDPSTLIRDVTLRFSKTVEPVKNEGCSNLAELEMLTGPANFVPAPESRKTLAGLPTST
jgi:hypothetical protein